MADGHTVILGSSRDARLVYFRPRCPSKANGRRGTRRAWKKAFPPGGYWQTTRMHYENNVPVRVEHSMEAW